MDIALVMNEICCELDKKLKNIDKFYREIEDDRSEMNSTKIDELKGLVDDFKDYLTKSSRQLPNYIKQKYLESAKNIDKLFFCEKTKINDFFGGKSNGGDFSSEKNIGGKFLSGENFGGKIFSESCALKESGNIKEKTISEDLRDSTNGLGFGAFTEFSNMETEGLVIEDYADSEIFVNGGCESLNISRVYHSVIFVKDPVRREVYVSDCEDVTIILMCQQFRVDTSNTLTCFIHTTSENGIAIENSYDLKFGNHPTHPETQFKVIDFSQNSSDDSIFKNYKILPSDKSVKSVFVKNSKINILN